MHLMSGKGHAEDEVTRIARDIAEHCIARRVRQQARVISRIYDEQLRPHGVNASQVNMLVALALLGEVQPAQLARQLQLEKSTLSRNLARMQKRGWIRVETSDDDARRQRVSLTPAGRTTLRAAHPAWQAAQAAVKRTLEPQVLEGLFAVR